MTYPLYLTRDELRAIANAVNQAQHEPCLIEPATTAKKKTELLLRMAEYSEVADQAERAYCDLTRDYEVYELITD